MNNTVDVPHTVQPRSGYLRRALRNQTRIAYHGAIVAAAETILLRDGFKHTKMADIAEATGVSVGTLYNYFESKEAVLKAIMDQHYLRFQEQLALPFDSDDPTLRLAQLVDRVHGFVEQNRDLFQLYFRTESERLDSPKATASVAPTSVLERVSLRMRDLLENCLRRGQIRSDIPLDVLVWSLQALLGALFTEWYRNPEGISLTARGRDLVSLFLAGARTAT